MVSVMTEVPSAFVARAMYCACMSVAKPGYSSVVTSAARSFLGARTRIVLSSRTSTSTPAPAPPPGLVHFGDDPPEMTRRAVREGQIPAGDCARDEERAGLDAVG